MKTDGCMLVNSDKRLPMNNMNATLIVMFMANNKKQS